MRWILRSGAKINRNAKTIEISQQAQNANKVSLKTRVYWGLGGLADNYITSAFITLVMPVYNIALGMNAVLLGWAVCIPRFTDAVVDVWIGNISDNTRTRWGRRRPYIFVGAILSAIILPLLWIPPFKTDSAMFIYLLIVGLVYFLAYSIYVVPYTALGYELTTDYNDRTRVLAWRMYIGLFGSFTVPWFYWLSLKIQNILVKLPAYAKDSSGLHQVFVRIQSFMGTSTSAGAFWLSVGLGGIIIITGILPVLMCRENAQNLTQPKIHIFSAIFHTIRNRPFLILCAAYIIVILGLFSAGTLGLYVNIYYVCGSKELAAKISGINGSVGAVTSYLSLFLIMWISARSGKRNAMIIGLIFALVGVCSSWWTLSPRWPYLQIASYLVSCIGLQGCWLIVSSMVADICDEDELKTGLRREGVYGAVNGLAFKVALALTAVAGGALLNFSGYDPKVAESVGSVPIEIAMKMKTLLVGGQAISLVFAIIIFLFYPITRQRSEETRRILDKRHYEKSSQNVK